MRQYRLFVDGKTDIVYYLAADVDPLLARVRAVLEYYIQRHERSLIMPTTVDWSQAKALLADLTRGEGDNDEQP